jgi:hypothetical protein
MLDRGVLVHHRAGYHELCCDGRKGRDYYDLCH